MKIAVLGINFHPEPIGISVYTTDMCEYLADKGHEVTMFTGFPYYPTWRREKVLGKRFLATHIHRGIQVKRSYVYVPRHVAARTRVLHELSFMISSFLRILFSRRADLLVTVSPPLGLGLVAYLINKIRGVPFIFHVQDLQPDAAEVLGMIKSRRLLRVLQCCEKFIYKKAAKITVISSTMEDRIRQKVHCNGNLTLFPNWVDSYRFRPLPKVNAFSRQHGLVGKFAVLYSGNIGYKQGLDVLAKMAAAARGMMDVVFVIAGDGAFKPKLIETIAAGHIDNVMFLPVIAEHLFPLALASCDVCFVPQKRVAVDFAFPSKLLAIMASGRPVIAGASVGSELHGVITEARCGIVAEPGSWESAFEAVKALHDHPEELVVMGSNARAYAQEHFGRLRTLQRFEGILPEFAPRPREARAPAANKPAIWVGAQPVPQVLGEVRRVAVTHTRTA